MIDAYQVSKIIIVQIINSTKIGVIPQKPALLFIAFSKFER